MKSGSIVTVLDIGSTKVCCCIASVSGDGYFSILGAGYCVCVGVKAGVIIDMQSVEMSVAKAVEEAEKLANFRVESVYVSISGSKVKSKIVSASSNIGGKIVTVDDVMRLISFCEHKNEECEIIHAIPITFCVDSLTDIKDPVGMMAHQLKIDINIVTAPEEQLNNLLVCLTKCHLKPVGVVVASYASGLCVYDERDISPLQIIVDFGAGTTCIAFFYNHIFCGCEMIPIGGKHITNDIAYGLGISFANAERIKTLHGAAFVSMDDERNTILVPVLEDNNVIDSQQVSRGVLNNIIQSRVEEIFAEVKQKIEKSVFGKYIKQSTIIFTGGGSQLTGIRDFAMIYFGRKIKSKKTGGFDINASIHIENDFATAFGMIKFAQISDVNLITGKPLRKRSKKVGFLKKAFQWIENNL